MGKVAIIRDTAAVTYVKPVVNRPSCLTMLLEFRGYALFLIHGRDQVRPVQIVPRSSIPCAGKDRRLGRSETPIPVCEINLQTRRHGD